MNRTLAPLALLIVTSAAVAGPLDPPAGPIAPTQKPLVEVEPRIAINAANTPGDANSVFRISQPGSYYLTGNVTGVAARNGVEIAASNVTVDLAGFALIGVPGSLSGVATEGQRNDVVVRNGTVSQWGDDGVDLITGGAGLGSLIENISASNNGAIGIRPNANGVVRACSASSNIGGGIGAGVSVAIVDCAVRSNGGPGISTGIGSTVTSCSVRANDGVGISTLSASVISGCAVYDNGGDGILVGDGSVIVDCVASDNSGNGIAIAAGCIVRANACASNGLGIGDGAGIHVAGADNRIEGNVCTVNDRGVDVDATGNIIVRNSCSGNTTNWTVIAGNVCLVVNAATAGAINGNAGGVAPGSTDPSANFTY